MDLVENVIFGLTIALFISNIIFPGSLVTFIFSVIVLILVLLFYKRRDKKTKK